ncbi:acyl carrier protein [Anaerocolumna cellulosilytica]|uniref:Acyl carrier protein n=1 Tax=Anaerocolumna cellulosilytica TaxID=433286 RepID=A0A6S6R397_9FIRM|nr:acyl carrier protein [Anaerocolumna cellulosilytica]MBB5196720.1 polyketide biosynthesis acyl carrier protein [Anaerocolumna cellulosilytica]BCJ93982.1 acyl carrier protein [Anaerocolumna cellulosilytica]
MDKNNIFSILKSIIVQILPEIDIEQITLEDSLKEIGANSIDRMDIIIETMEQLGVKIPLVEFGQLKNIEGIVDLLYSGKVS